MNTEQIKDALVALLSLYKTMEQEYSINLTDEVKRVLTVLEDIDKAIQKAEGTT